MKKKLLGVIMVASMFLGGCVKNDTMENINIITTAYPTTYIVNALYSNHARKINSIYPAEVNISDYNLNEKQLKDYSVNDMFIYNGTSNEPKYAIELLNLNKNVKIVDGARGMEYSYSTEELWLDPFNFLMIAQNIKNGFIEYVKDPYIQDEIEKKYDELNMNVSELDVAYKEMSENAVNKTIVVQNDLWKFLEKYNINVMSLENQNEISAKTLADIKTMVKDGTIEYIFLTDNEEANDITKELIGINENLKTEKLSSLSNLSDEDEENGEDYITIMSSNIEKMRKELYK